MNDNEENDNAMAMDSTAEANSGSDSALENVECDEMMSEGTGTNSKDGETISALRANIKKKGKNAYYFAHANTANGPEWDGKAEPKLLGKSDVAPGSHATKATLSRSLSSFDPSSSIKSYAFLDEETKVKLYITIPNVLEDYPNEEDIVLEYTSQSFELSLYRVPPTPASAISEDGEVEMMQEESCEPEMTTTDEAPNTQRACDKRLAFSKLYGPIEKVAMKKKSDKIILTFTKAEEISWPCIGAKE